MRRAIVLAVASIAVLALTCCGLYGVVRFKANAVKERTVIKLKKDVARDLHDPESVRFRDLKLLSTSDYLEGISEWVQAFEEDRQEFMKALKNDPGSVLSYDERHFSMCGQLNAENRLGAYVGYSSFYVSNTDPAKPFVVIEGLGWDKEFIGKMCKIGVVVQSPRDDPGM